jgi:phosphate transport system permease protein
MNNMTDLEIPSMTEKTDKIDSQHKADQKRKWADLRFRLYGLLGLSFAAIALILILFKVFSTGFGAFQQTTLSMEFHLDADVLGVTSESKIDELQDANTLSLVKKSIYKLFPDVKKRKDKRRLTQLLSASAEWFVRDEIVNDPWLIGSTITLKVPLSSNVDQYYKALLNGEDYKGRLKPKQITWFETLEQQGLVYVSFNTDFFTRADSRYPEIAGIAAALVGSMYSLLICLIIAFPIGVAAAIYLEEFAKKSMLSRIIEVNINNLAAVPSIIFGLLGLAVILNVFDVPRSTPIAGGIVLALMTLPTIIIACRTSIKAVSPSIREAGLAMGASKVQVVFHHVMPAAMSGTLTGTIIGLAQALGETAPLLMIGMVAFIANVPSVPTDAASALPVQIYLWAESAERGFVEKTAAAIMVLIVVLILMILLAIFLRNKTRQR